MRKPVFAAMLLLSLLCAPLSFGQTKAATPAAGGEDWNALDHKWLDSERTGDFAYLEKFFADSYVLVLANGQMYTKKEWLGILKSPDHPVIVSINPENVQAHVFGNVAILTDHTTLKGHDAKGNSLDGVFNVFRVVIKENGEWHATGVVMNEDRTKK
ncbi:MAG TPA: nuclear transport factor 2 family protein [Candidatus Acidoferrales bacterium]|nr:nuclear transport factor 2 family protein [Candidatus Acidoferrales bacterium]